MTTQLETCRLRAGLFGRVANAMPYITIEQNGMKRKNETLKEWFRCSSSANFLTTSDMLARPFSANESSPPLDDSLLSEKDYLGREGFLTHFLAIGAEQKTFLTADLAKRFQFG
jgi:hypothetical protein